MCSSDLFDPVYGYGTSFRQITDGTSSTTAVVETAPETAVDWTNPDGHIAFDPANSMAGLGVLSDDILAAMFDGSVGTFHPSIDPAQFKKWITIAGAEFTDQTSHRPRAIGSEPRLGSWTIDHRLPTPERSATCIDSSTRTFPFFARFHQSDCIG